MKTHAQHSCSKHTPIATIAGALIERSNRDLLGFHSFLDSESGETYGSFLIFEHAPNKPWSGFPAEEPFEHGFYWQSCFPGCLPDGDSCGPFKTARDAYKDAQEG